MEWKIFILLHQQIPPRLSTMRTRAELRFYRDMGLKYDKKTLTYEEIIGQLKDRGLLFRDEKKALQALTNICYFRIANYLRYFETDSQHTDLGEQDTCGQCPEVCHQYKTGSYFEDALDLYYFDKKLRCLLFPVIQSVEVSLRSKMIHYVALKYEDPFWFLKDNLCLKQTLFVENLNAIKREIDRSKDEFIKDHLQKYSEPDIPPVWKSLEVSSFGTISKLYCNLKDNKIKKSIARQFNLPQHEVLESWIKSIVILRNSIAHHARIWNRRFPLMPQLSMPLRGAWIDGSHIYAKKLYAQLCCLAYLENSIHPDNDFKIQLKKLFSEYPSINLHAMGFPDNWQEQPLWK